MRTEKELLELLLEETIKEPQEDYEGLCNTIENLFQEDRLYLITNDERYALTKIYNDYARNRKNRQFSLLTVDRGHSLCKAGHFRKMNINVKKEKVLVGLAHGFAWKPGVKTYRIKWIKSEIAKR